MGILVETADAVTVVTIARPARRNAVDPATARDLFAAFLAFEADPAARVAVLTGADGAFCAGFDLKAAGSGAADDWIAGLGIPEHWDDPCGDPLAGPMGPSRLMLSKPVIAAIEGPAVAGGMELAAWCDLRVMAEGAVTGVFCRRWGVPLIDGGTVRLPRVVGQGRALDLILTGRRVDADEALAIGLANRVVLTGQARAAAVELAQQIAAFPQATMRADRLSALRQWDWPLPEAVHQEWAAGRERLQDALEGATRFAAGDGRHGRF